MMPRSSLEKHVVLCGRRKIGYSKEEADVTDPQFFYEKAKVASVLIDKSKQFQIITDARSAAARDEKSWDKRKWVNAVVLYRLYITAGYTCSARAHTSVSV
ncbi:hypothetical protein GDO78_017163 [Eleutherodactylus coqui]|uniref:Uncharacterized protein n=1 Tax=Eleutherodactylus coqui TaxID=57060 RepID=A0A8J6E3J2_ELECQ|nr:hypothetical protein GDO78_017163 [Eleutherodactylus coqui]